MAGVKDGEYSYIQVFIDYLKQIIDIIKDLFASIGGKTETPPEGEA